MRPSYNLATIHPASAPWLQWYIFAWLSNVEIMEWHCPCATTAIGVLLAARERVHMQMAVSYNRCATPFENEPSQRIERQPQLMFLPLLKLTRSKQITVTKIYRPRKTVSRFSQLLRIVLVVSRHRSHPMTQRVQGVSV